MKTRKYAIWTLDCGRRVWALIIRQNKNGTARVKIGNDWHETIHPERIVNQDYIKENFLKVRG